MTKANNGSGNIEERDDWQTPQELWDQLNEQYKFDFDCCADDQNSKCNVWSTNFLHYNEAFKDEVHWMNPPFSKAEVMIQHFFKVVKKGVGIYRCDNMETKVWQSILKNSNWIFIFNRRVQYEGKVGKGARFGSALFGVGVPPPKRDDGTVLFTGMRR